MSIRKNICAGIATGLAAMALTSPALAHPGHEAATVASGILHPLSGADHMLAMIAVGLWASLRGGKAMWAWPAAFVTAMLAGFALGQWSGGISVEPLILASVIVLGALTAADARASTALGVVLIAAFGLAHGYAHGVEAPSASLNFPLGFAVSTAALHLAGLAMGRLQRPTAVRLIGAGTALGGLALALAA